MPATVHNLQQILERINTLEQPRLEEILDSVNDSVEESQDLLKEVKKLFVIRTWRRLPDAEIPQPKLARLQGLEKSLADVSGLLTKQTALSKQLLAGLIEAQPAKYEMPKSPLLQPGGPPHGPIAPGPGHVAGEVFPNNPRTSPEPIEGQLQEVLSSGPSVSIRGKSSKLAIQPMAARFATLLNNSVVTAQLDNYATVSGRVRFFEREKIKIERSIHRIRWVLVEEPGVIPKLLEELRGAVAGLRSGVLPRVELILDNVNASAVASTTVLQSANGILSTVQSGFNAIRKYSLMVKISLFAGGGLLLLILLMSLIVLFRMAFGL